MKVSMVVPTLNCNGDLKILLDSIVNLKLDEKIEFIAVDAKSIDGTIELLKKYSFPKIVEVGLTSKGTARNIGIKNATGDVIVNTDSDVEILPDWYEALIHSMKNSDIVAGYSPDPNHKHLPRVPIYIDGQDVTWPTCNIAHKKKVFDKVGYFNEDENMAEDCEFNYRCVKAGYVIDYNPHMKVYHYQRSSKINFAKQAFWNGEARYELNTLHPEMKQSHYHGVSLKNFVRLGFGFLGFTIGRYIKVKGEKYNEYKGETSRDGN